MPLCSGFIQQRDVDAQPAIRVDRRRGAFCPARADGGMEDFLESMAFRWVAEDSFAEPDPVGTARRIKSPSSESTENRIPDTRVCRQQLPRTSVGVE
jgi:hypothetical protein